MARAGSGPRLRLAAACVVAAAALAACQAAEPPPAPASSVCAMCQKPIPAGDEVWLTAGESKPKPYRCIHCALTAQSQAPVPCTVEARTPISQTTITIHHDAAGWHASPSTAVFLSLPEMQGECVDRHRPFADEAEFRRYLAEHPELPAAGAVPYTIAQLAELLASGRPGDGG